MSIEKKVFEKKIPDNETRYNDLVGVVSINLNKNEDFNEFASEIAHYNPDRFQAVAMRVFFENNSSNFLNTPIVTIYAVDKENPKRLENGKIPVRKFKFEISFEQLFIRLRQLNFTVTDGDFDLSEMEVTNR
jgi:hypothetical protein